MCRDFSLGARFPFATSISPRFKSEPSLNFPRSAFRARRLVGRTRWPKTQLRERGTHKAEDCPERSRNSRLEEKPWPPVTSSFPLAPFLAAASRPLAHTRSASAARRRYRAPARREGLPVRSVDLALLFRQRASAQFNTSCPGFVCFLGRPGRWAVQRSHTHPIRSGRGGPFVLPALLPSSPSLSPPRRT